MIGGAHRKLRILVRTLAGRRSRDLEMPASEPGRLGGQAAPTRLPLSPGLEFELRERFQLRSPCWSASA